MDRRNTSCSIGKMSLSRIPKLSKSTNSVDIFVLIHADLIGPFEENSIDDDRYALILLDDWAKNVFIYCVKTKGEAANCILEFLKMVERQSGKRVKRFRSDNGVEFVNSPLSIYFNLEYIFQRKRYKTRKVRL